MSADLRELIASLGLLALLLPVQTAVLISFGMGTLLTQVQLDIQQGSSPLVEGKNVQAIYLMESGI